MLYNRADMIREAHRQSLMGNKVEAFVISTNDEKRLLSEIIRDTYLSIHKRDAPTKITSIAGIPVQVSENIKEGKFLIAVETKV